MRFSWILVLLIISQAGWSQPFSSEKAWVFFVDKDVESYYPHEYLSQHTIERRKKHNIAIYDVADIPVKQDYVNTITEMVESLTATSRWFNAVCVYADEKSLNEIRNLDFVRDVKVVNPGDVLVAGKSIQKDLDFSLTERQKTYIQSQLERMEGDVFAKNNVRGQGITIAVFDVGFNSYKTNPAFKHLRDNNQIKATYDFVKNKENVDVKGSHGTTVLSCIGGRLERQDMGLATEANYLLARTETWTEFYSEEENWLEAVEWADKLGADIINSSLGYTYHRYFREDMDGQTSLVAKAANMAASKGILVVNSAGNEGSANWKNIGTPADADSVLSIGGISPYTGVHTSFSSFGPTWDKRLKPNVSAYGHGMVATPDGVGEVQGTSFSSPLIAGFAACAMQSRPAYSNMKLFHDIQKSADLYPYYDYAHGYGIPQASYFFKMPQQQTPEFTLELTNTAVKINLKPRDNGLQPAEQDRNGVYYTKWPDYVFYHVENDRGYLDKYVVVDPELKDREASSVDIDGTVSDSPLKILKSELNRPCTVRVYYRGVTQEIIVK